MSVFPLLDPPAGETAATLAAALGVGVAFGWALERGGMGSARKLAAQFYGRDFTVVKVMFSAIVTAMLGLFWLSRTGLLDASRLYVPPTVPAAQLIGGALFGVGFLVAGLCPGTACVSGASGRLDGLAAVGGLLAGTALFEAARPLLGDLPTRGEREALRLPELLGAPEAVVVAAVAALALAAFVVAERFERAAGGVADASPRRATRRPLVFAAGALGIGALGAAPREAAFDAASIAAAVEREEDHVTALELARWIRDGKPGLRVVDVRAESAYAELHVPGAERSSLEALVGAPARPGETLVLYSEGGTHAAQGWVLLRARGRRDVYVLRGGLYEWITDVLEAKLPAGADSAARAAWPEVSALSRYFGGQPRADAPAGDGAVPIPRTRAFDPHEEEHAADAVRRVRRRGC